MAKRNIEELERRVAEWHNDKEASAKAIESPIQYGTFHLDVALSAIEDKAADFTAEQWEEMGNFCAKWMLNHVGKLNPQWQRLIDAARIETGRSDWKLLGSWIARTLERGDHISASPHPFFEEGSGRIVEKKCEECGKLFMPSIPGQRFDSNDCGTAAFKRSYHPPV